jgi:hypothetical protein
MHHRSTMHHRSMMLDHMMLLVVMVLVLRGIGQCQGSHSQRQHHRSHDRSFHFEHPFT